MDSTLRIKYRQLSNFGLKDKVTSGVNNAILYGLTELTPDDPQGLAHVYQSLGKAKLKAEPYIQLTSDIKTRPRELLRDIREGNARSLPQTTLRQKFDGARDDVGAIAGVMTSIIGGGIRQGANTTESILNQSGKVRNIGTKIKRKGAEIVIDPTLRRQVGTGILGAGAVGTAGLVGGTGLAGYKYMQKKED